MRLLHSLSVLGLMALWGVGTSSAQSMRADTYCNPLNVDYTYMIYNSANNLSYRSGADPAVVEFRGRVLYVCYSLAWLLALDRPAQLGVHYAGQELVSARF